MGLRRRKDGSYVISSRSHVTVALHVLDELDAEIAEIRAGHLATLEQRRAQLKRDIDEWVLGAESYEDDAMKLTRVASKRRYWDTARLEKILPRGIFKNIVKIEADPDKIDQYVRAGRINAKMIEPALVEEPNAPYVKWTRKRQDEGAGEAEAAGLLAAMGG